MNLEENQFVDNLIANFRNNNQRNFNEIGNKLFGSTGIAVESEPVLVNLDTDTLSIIKDLIVLKASQNNPITKELVQDLYIDYIKNRISQSTLDTAKNIHKEIINYYRNANKESLIEQGAYPLKELYDLIKRIVPIKDYSKITFMLISLKSNKQGIFTEDNDPYDIIDGFNNILNKYNIPKEIYVLDTIHDLCITKDINKLRSV